MQSWAKKHFNNAEDNRDNENNKAKRISFVSHSINTIYIIFMLFYIHPSLSLDFYLQRGAFTYLIYYTMQK